MMLSKQNSRWQFNKTEAAWLDKPTQGPVMYDTKVHSKHIVKMKKGPLLEKLQKFMLTNIIV